MTHEIPTDKTDADATGGYDPAPPGEPDGRDEAPGGAATPRMLPHQAFDFTAVLPHFRMPQDAVSASVAAMEAAIGEHRALLVPPLPSPVFELPQFDLGLSAAASRLDTGRLIGADALLNSPALQHLEGLAMPDPSRWLPTLDVPTPAFMSALHTVPSAAGLSTLEQLTGRNWTSAHLESALASRTTMAHWLDAQVPRVDMSAYSDVIGAGLAATAKFQWDLTEVGRSLAAVVPAIERMTAQLAPCFVVMPSPSEMVGGFAIASSLSSAITDLMCGWNVLSGLGHQLSNWALQMALRVRRELINNPDRDAVRRMVVWFMRHVLGYVRVEFDDQVEATSSASLADTWLPASHHPARDLDERGRDVRRQLRALTDRQRNLWRPIPTTTLCGQKATELEAPIKGRRGASGDDDDDDRPKTEGDRITAREFVPAQPPLSDPQLKRMLATFTQVEQEVVWKKFHDGRTWDDAVIESGLPLRDSARIRRKFARVRNFELKLKARTA
jgi:hypothetical protein